MNSRMNDLERQANMLLYGCPNELDKTRTITPVRPYRPKNNDVGEVWRMPKSWREKRHCKECRRPISDMAASMCRRCYSASARTRYAAFCSMYNYWSRYGAAIDNGETIVTMTKEAPDAESEHPL